MTTAQELFKCVMRDMVGPGLRELGFGGGYTRGFQIARGDYAGFFETQKSRYSTKTEVDFWVHLYARHTPTNAQYWRMIAEGAADDPRCRVVLSDRRERDPSRRVRRYAAALLFPSSRHDEGGDGPPSLDAIAWVLQPTGRSADKWFAKLDAHSVGRRQDALRMVDEEAADDPRTLPALLDRLARDPSPEVREDAAAALASRGREATVQRALQDAADQDEDLQVRWAARYAISLAASDET